MDIQIFLFDNDGIFIDTEGAAARHDLPFFQEFGIAFTPAEYAYLMSGKTRDEYLELIEHHRVTKGAPPLPDNFYYLLRQEHARQVETGLAGPVEGSEKLLRYAVKRNVPRAVISNGDMDAMIHKLMKINYYERLKGHIYNPQSADCAGKPKPDMIYHAMRQYGVTDSSKAIFYGDSAFDMLAGREAGVHTVGYSGGDHRPKDYGDYLMDNGASVVFPSMEEIVKYTRKIDDNRPRRSLKHEFTPN